MGDGLDVLQIHFQLYDSEFELKSTEEYEQNNHASHQKALLSCQLNLRRLDYKDQRQWPKASQR